MKTMGFAIDTEGLKLVKEDEKKSPQKLVSEILQIMMLSYAQEIRGFNEIERRIFHKIIDIFENATETGGVLIEIDDTYADLLIKSKKDGRMMPNKLTQRVEKLIDGIKDKPKKDE